MSSGFAISYHRFIGPEDFSRLEVGLADADVHLQRPTDGAVTLLSDVGDQVIGSRDAILAILTAGKTLNFQWWFRDGGDLYCRFRSGETVAIDVGLDGLTGHQFAGVKQSLMGFAATEIAHSNFLGMVIDRMGTTEEFDWDGFFSHSGVEFEGALPDLLVVQSPDLSRIHGTGRECDQRILDGLVILQGVLDNGG